MCEPQRADITRTHIVKLLRGFLLSIVASGLLSTSGCAIFEPPKPPTSESQTITDTIQLTHAPEFDRAGEAYFSPDMKWIIFQAAPPGEQNYQMYLAELKYDGGNIAGIDTPIRISPPGTRNTCGFFSPDGRSIIFASTKGKEDPNEPASGYQREGHNYRWSFPKGMEIYRNDNWQAAVKSREAGKDLDLATTALTSNDVYDAEGSFSPDGKWIVFSSMRSNDGDVFVMRSDGTHTIPITDNPGYDGGPFFSPDGKHLVYRSDRAKNNLLQIYTCDLAFDHGDITGVKAEHQLTSDVNVNWGPYWYPDGKHIIFATSRHGHANYELYTIRTDGSHATRITFTAGADILPVFSPDGKYLMWTSTRSPEHKSQIYVGKFIRPRSW